MSQANSSPIVDSHFHVWDLNRFSYLWPTKEQKILYRNVTVEEYISNVSSTPVQYGVFVQVLHPDHDTEAEWILDETRNSDVIKGIVAGLDLTHPRFEETLDRLSKEDKFIGVRHILDFEDQGWLLREDVHKGLDLLQEKGLTYDLLLRPPLIKIATQVCRKFPSLRFVVDHIAKPLMQQGTIVGWKEDLAELASLPNVFCKISGLVNEVGEGWSVKQIRPYVQHAVDVFGSERCMFGSDWPVSTEVGVTYQQVYQLARQLLSHLTTDEQNQIFGLNCVRCYRLKL